MSERKRTVCVVTGSRAEYGLLYWLMKEIQVDPDLLLQVIVTGMHLSPEFGLTYRVIEADGFHINAKVEMLLSSDTPVGIAKSMGLASIGFADALERLSPDLLVVLGDRYEILAVAQVAMVMQIPIAHLGGGDNGAGTYDNIIRHCISKMASLHFVTHADAGRRVIQLGELPDRVFNVGGTGVDNIVKMEFLSQRDLEQGLGATFKDTIFLVTFHPLTMDESSGLSQLRELLAALDMFQKKQDCSVVFTKANADNGGRAMITLLEDYVGSHAQCYLFDSLGQLRYLSLMKLASVVVGNSSSGLYEAPYLQTPTVDIGSRQEGRAAPSSVIRCGPERTSIYEAINRAMSFEFNSLEMIYGDGTASLKILSQIKAVIDTPKLAVKTFFDLDYLK